MDPTDHNNYECADIFIFDDYNNVYGYLDPKGIGSNPSGAIPAANNKLVHLHFRQLVESGQYNTHKYVINVNAKHDGSFGDVYVTVEPK